MSRNILKARGPVLAALLALTLAACQGGGGASQPAAGDPLAVFARCLKDSGAKFYGAEWCSHCNSQKQDFKEAAGELPYVECAVPNGQGQAPECAGAGIRAYPTWQFANGTTQSGRLAFAVLAEKTGCAAP